MTALTGPTVTSNRVRVFPADRLAFVLFPFSYAEMAFTKGESLRHAIPFALRSVRLAGQRLELTKEDRFQVAADTVRELRRHGEWKELDDEVYGCPSVAQSAKQTPHSRE